MNTQKKKEIKEKKFLCFLENFLKENGYSPSFREIAKELNCSLCTVHRTLHNLKEEGFISFDCGKNRTIAIIKKDKKMTNYEKIKAMSVEEMAIFLYRNVADCEMCPAMKSCKASSELTCKERLLEWLKSEVEEDGVK